MSWAYQEQLLEKKRLALFKCVLGPINAWLIQAAEGNHSSNLCTLGTWEKQRGSKAMKASCKICLTTGKFRTAPHCFQTTGEPFLIFKCKIGNHRLLCQSKTYMSNNSISATQIHCSDPRIPSFPSFRAGFILFSCTVSLEFSRPGALPQLHHLEELLYAVDLFKMNILP